MQKLNTISFSRCTNSELHVGTTRILDECATYLPQDALAIETIDLIRGKVDDMDKTLSIIGSNPLTGDVRTKHIRRTKLVVGLSGMLRCIIAADGDQPERVGKAQKLLAIVNQQAGSLGRTSYMKTSSAIRVILGEFDTAENAVIVDELGLTGPVGRMRTAQAQFETAFERRVTLAGTTPRIMPLRKAISYEVGGLLTHVDHLAVRNPQALETLVNKLNEQITAIMTSVRARATRNQVEKATPIDAGKGASTA
jgi:hypothetical protein